MTRQLDLFGGEGPVVSAPGALVASAVPVRAPLAGGAQLSFSVVGLPEVARVEPAGAAWNRADLDVLLGALRRHEAPASPQVLGYDVGVYGAPVFAVLLPMLHELAEAGEVLMVPTTYGERWAAVEGSPAPVSVEELDAVRGVLATADRPLVGISVAQELGWRGAWSWSRAELALDELLKLGEVVEVEPIAERCSRRFVVPGGASGMLC